nr:MULTISPECIES: sugar transferase [unclassified Endozoicomonas]
MSNRVFGLPFWPILQVKNEVYRFLDCLLALLGLILSSPLLLVIYIMGFLDTGSPLFSQERVGRYKKPFVLVKFRTMQVDTISVASHLVPSSSITPLGRFLRKTKLDELPQLWNVLVGDMSLVGPRPNLFNQKKLIEAREQLGVYNVLPGVTGLAQVRQIDMSTPELLARTDSQMIRSLTLQDYFKYILMTATGRGRGDRVR